MNASVPDRRWPWADWLCLACLALAALRLTGSLESYLDLGHGDETWYLHGGLMIGRDGLPQAQWGPLYSLWYWLLHGFQPDPVKLFYLNYRVLTVAVAALLYVAVRRMGARSLVAWFSATFYLLSPLPHVWPRVSQFAVLILLVALAIGARAARPTRRWAILAVAFLLASYCRPEFFVAFLAAALGLVVASVRSSPEEPAACRNRIGRPAVILAGCIGMICAIGNPLASEQGTNRSLVAFSQHYALNLYERTGNPKDPWTTSGPLVDRVFDHPKTLTEALAHNPAAFFGHVWDNLRRLPGNLLRDVAYPLSLQRGHRAVTVLGWIAVAATALAWTLQIRRAAPRGHETVPSGSLAPLLGWMLALCALATLPSVLVIFPRVHYLVPVATLGVGAILLWSGAAWRPARLGRLALAAIAGALLTPDYFVGWRLPATSGPEMPARATVQFLRGLHVTGPVRLLERDPLCYAYAGENWSSVAAYDKPAAQDFLQFLHTRTVDAVLLTPNLETDPRYRDDASLRQFVREPEAAGFTRHIVPGLGATLYLRAGLAAGPPSPFARPRFVGSRARARLAGPRRAPLPEAFL